MRTHSILFRSVLAASALMMAVPAFAGDEERARAAIAEAQGKLDAAARVQAGNVAPDAIAHAQASLKLAQAELKSGKEQKAIRAALEAQQFADTAIGRTQARSAATVDAQAAVASDAQQQAQAANMRADAAEQAAAAASADAAAARAAPPVMIAPAPTTTTVTTETVKRTPATVRRTVAKKPVKRVATRTTRRAPAATTTEKTTTTVTTN